jgi:hypothetical protein
VTLHDNLWAFCPGGYVASRKGHFWTAIEPTKVTELPRSVGLVRRKDFV